MNPWIDVAGWTLVHFVWQGAIAAAAGAAVLHLLRAASPQARYIAACAVLAVMVAAPAMTAAVMVRSHRALQLPPAVREGSLAPQDLARSANMEATSSGVFASASEALDAPASIEGTPQPSTTQPSTIQPALPLVVFAWTCGVLILLARTAGGWIRVRRLHRASFDAIPSRWERACSRLAVLLGVTRLVRVVDSPFVDTPTVIGWMRPVILLPIAALAGLSPSQVDAILAHELAHIRRHDFLVNLLQTLAETLLFYHPAVWWMSARIRAEREHCCDVIAVSVCGDAVSYAEALTELETWRTSTASLAVAATGGSLLARVRRLLAVPADDAPRFTGAMSIAAAALVVMLGAGTTFLLGAARPEAANQDDTAPVSTSSSAGAPAWKMVFHHDSGELALMGFTARDLIRFAYQIPKARVAGGPAWLDQEIEPIAVDIQDELDRLPESQRAVGHLLDPPAADQMPGIVRRILESRFRLQVHVERRDLPAYALVMANADGTLGPNLRVSTVDCFDRDEWIAAGRPPRQLRPRQWVCGEEDWNSGITRTSYIAITMPQLAATMGGFAQIPLRGIRLDPGLEAAAQQRLDVVDRTGLTGRYDVEINALLPAVALMAHFPVLRTVLEPIGFPSMPRALEQQLGLKLVDTTAPYDVIVIDHAERPAG